MQINQFVFDIQLAWMVSDNSGENLCGGSKGGRRMTTREFGWNIVELHPCEAVKRAVIFRACKGVGVSKVGRCIIHCSNKAINIDTLSD